MYKSSFPIIIILINNNNNKMCIKCIYNNKIDIIIIIKNLIINIIFAFIYLIISKYKKNN